MRQRVLADDDERGRRSFYDEFFVRVYRDEFLGVVAAIAEEALAVLTSLRMDLAVLDWNGERLFQTPCLVWQKRNFRECLHHPRIFLELFRRMQSDACSQVALASHGFAEDLSQPCLVRGHDRICRKEDQGSIEGNADFTPRSS